MTVSWGGYESLLFPVAAVHPANAPLDSPGALPLSLVRLSIGLEEPHVLIDDLEAALARL
jgi:cystathionine beta-lyase/cystathionine gamma-synthase